MDDPAAIGSDTRSEQLLRDAHIARVRGRFPEAESLCRRALDLTPDDVMGLEMLGDLLLEKGEWDDALARFRRALELQPEKASLEEKIARIALRKSEAERERAEAELLLASPTSKVAAKRNATVAILLSLVCPGAGQVFNRQPVKGAIIVAVWLPSLFGMMELFKLLLALMGAGGRLEPHQGLAVLGLLGILIWIYAMIDASSGAQGGRSRLSE
jgi:tetratricopeptide (TPR) repeat protein